VAVVCYAATAIAIGFAWWWLGAPQRLPASPLAAGAKLACISYAPFHGDQDPLIETTHVDAAQIEEDLTLLSRYTDCVRTYSIENGLDQIPAVAQRHGVKVMQGLWLSNKRDKNRQQVETVVALAKTFPNTISAVIVGNEVLLRGDLSVGDLAAYIREVKTRVAMPVTYADVWEFWLRHPDLQSAVDFVTIHILPYWEDFPLPATLAAAHVDAIRKQVAAAIPSKEIFPCRARKVSRQRDRSFQSAMEALARRRNRRLLGYFRSRNRRAEISVQGACLRSSTLAVASDCRDCLECNRLRQRLVGAGRQVRGGGAGGVVAAHRGPFLCVGGLVRLDTRTDSDRQFQLRHLAARHCFCGDGSGCSGRMCRCLRRGPHPAGIRNAARRPGWRP
jgi:hypothetical protein